MVFCTLYDSNYLDKGIAMYRSLAKVTSDFKMYVLAMDEKCESVLKDYNYSQITVIPLQRFCAVMRLEEIQKSRSRGEFCWTCTSHLIDYVLTEFREPICTYVDSDLYFWSNPECLVEEMESKTVQIVEHRFTDNTYDRECRRASGTYCVEFNTFKNEESSLALLRWWKSKCRESCSSESNGCVFGDQMYLESWGEKECVSVLNNLGGGVAPWNIAQYTLVNGVGVGSSLVLKERVSGKTFPLIFYHFHDIKYIEPRKAFISVYQRNLPVDRKLIKAIYIPYLLLCNEIKEELRLHYNIYPMLARHPGFHYEESKEELAEEKKVRTLSEKLRGSSVREIIRKSFHYLNNRLIKVSKDRIISRLNILKF